MVEPARRKFDLIRSRRMETCEKLLLAVLTAGVQKAFAPERHTFVSRILWGLTVANRKTVKCTIMLHELRAAG